MLLLLAIVLGLVWVGGFGIFHVGSALIHVLLVAALVSVIVHFVRRRQVS